MQKAVWLGLDDVADVLDGVRPMIDVSLESGCETSLLGEPSTRLTFGRVSVNSDIWEAFGNINHRSHPLDENEYLANGLLCGDRTHFMFDEPGVLLSGEFLLAWSRLKPTQLLAQVVATACTGEVLAEAERIARESVERKPALAARLDSTLGTYRRWWEDLQVPLAICWKRFRWTLPAHAAN